MNGPTNSDSGADVHDRVSQYYTDKVVTHGETPRGVDWNSEESQYLRFEQLLKVCDASVPFSIVDYGCGFGSLFAYLKDRDLDFTYTGYDISEEMLHRARERHGDDPRCRFVGRFDELEPADYAVASGVMNVKLEFELETWEEYVRRTIAELDAVGGRGFSFNLLTKYSDADRMRENLYYADPLVLFDHCKRTYSKYVALLHDYPLYEFTMLVRKPRP